MIGKDPRLKSLDFVPVHIKNQFNLPMDMEGFEIDFQEVRSTDRLFKRRRAEWSG